MASQSAAERLLNFDVPLDVAVLDETVAQLYKQNAPAEVEYDV